MKRVWRLAIEIFPLELFYLRIYTFELLKKKGRCVWLEMEDVNVEWRVVRCLQFVGFGSLPKRMGWGDGTRSHGKVVLYIEYRSNSNPNKIIERKMR